MRFFGKEKNMNIVYKEIEDLIPYEKNPRINDKAVSAVANSIKEFGFKVPIVIDSNNVIINGHTRLKASQLLGITQIPCIVADDLSEEQVKAFRIADNKTAEIAQWDEELLEEEFSKIANIDMSDFGFDLGEFDFEMESLDFEDETEEKIKENDRNKTYNAYNMLLFDDSDTDGKWQIPMIYRNDFIPERLIGFNYAKTSKDKNTGIHFFIDDYQFERCWNRPEEYVEILGDYECVLTPDFSLYRDMSMAVKLWNIYRSRLLGQFWQRSGLKVIPTISWCEKETFEFCFDGIEKGSVVAISTIGVKREEEAYKIWKDGVDEMIKRIHPSTILCYGGKVDYDFGKIKVVYYDNEVTERMKNIGGN